MKFKSLPPYAPTLIESTRAIGYSLEAAVADIIDNSIAARAKNVEIFFFPLDGEYIAILDDGNGMNGEEIDIAMQYGSKNPTEERDKKDLGRFVLFCEKNDFLVVQMALTDDKCRKILLESLGEKVAINHIILNASKQTIKDRIKERVAKGVDQRQALERLSWNMAYLNKYYKEDTWINTEEKSAESVADEIFSMIDKSRLQK